MKSLAQDVTDSLLIELKELLKSPNSSIKSDTTKSKNTSFQVPIRSTWYNIGDFNPAMKRQDGRTGHSGVDMSCSAGTPVYSIGDGVVNKVGNNSMGGNVVGIQHANNVWSYYAHLATIKVKEGDKVSSNTVVGTVGNTGNAQATWPHLHFGIKLNNGWVNPGNYFSIPKYDFAFAANPNKFQPFWTSDKAKEESKQFNIKNYKKAEYLAKLTNIFYNLSVENT